MSNPAGSLFQEKSLPFSVAQWLLGFHGTIRGRIVASFLVVGLITLTVGGLAFYTIRDSENQVRRTLQDPIGSIAAERALVTDFALLREAMAQRGGSSSQDERDSSRLDRAIRELRLSFRTHLSTLSGLDDPALQHRAALVDTAFRAWDDLQSRLKGADGDSAENSVRSRIEEAVDRELAALLDETTKEQAGLVRRALGAVATDLTLTLAGTAFSLVAIAVAAVLLMRQVIRPVAAASAVADRIAKGQLDAEIPQLGHDEVGSLLSSMRTMRGNMKSVMEREVALRRSAQTRLSDALDGSQDGIIVVDADLRIALANAQAANFLGTTPGTMAPGTPVFRMAGAAPSSRKLLLDLLSLEGSAEESRLDDGRWLRISRSTTREGGFVALCSDISVQKDQEAKLKATNLRLDAALENMSQGLCLYGANQSLLVVNRRFCEIFELPIEAISSGMTLRTVFNTLAKAGKFPNRHAMDVVQDEVRIFEKRQPSQRFLEIGGNRIVGVAVQPLSDGGWLSTVEDVTERRIAEERIAFMARHDALTQLPNRTLFAERVDQAAERSEQDHMAAILCLDLDHFKHVNDTLGHPIGDELLRAVSARLRDCVRSVDTVARLGGDEFAIVQPAIDSTDEAIVLANRIIERLSAPFNLEGDHHVLIGVSIGISLAPGDGTDHGKLLKNADVALYRAKEDGRGTFRFFEAEMDSRLQARRAMELDLRRALEMDQFEVWYQPQFDLRADKIVGFEALLRWRHPVNGMVGPGDFIPLAEEIGLIREIGAWTLATACRDAKNWPERLRVAVNVSPVQLRFSDFPALVERALSSTGLDVSRLELEITESVMLSSSVAALDLLHQVRALGVQISIDDFGTGYSSLTSLRSFPFSKIKIDKSFVQDLSTNAGAQAVIKAVIVLGAGLDVRTTAEGVETPEQMARLRVEGCSEVQGYYISPPVPVAEVSALLKKWNSGARRNRVAAVA